MPAQPPQPSAREAYKSALQEALLRPADPKTLTDLASTAVRAGDLEGAISALERLLLLSGDLPDIKLELGVLYFRLGSFTAARGYLEGAKASASASAQTKVRANGYLAEIPRQ
jgi:Flp pilus assembly protein TadD